MARVIKAEVDPPRFPVVNAEGQIKLIPLAPHVSTALEVQDGEVVLRRSYERKGWAMLQDLYARENRADLWKLWKDHRRAIEDARRESQSPPPPFPDKYLPREVQRRRAGQRPTNSTFSFPDLPEVSMDEPEEFESEPAPAPKRGRKPKVESEEV